jgi:hypothetical protein
MGCISSGKTQSEEGQCSIKKEEERPETKLKAQYSRGSMETL